MHMHNEEMPSKENISPVRRYLQIDFLDVFFFCQITIFYQAIEGKTISLLISVIYEHIAPTTEKQSF